MYYCIAFVWTLEHVDTFLAERIHTAWYALVKVKEKCFRLVSSLACRELYRTL